MNRHLHRVVFNAARGMRMVVQETAISTGKGESKASTAASGVLTGVALAGLLATTPLHAQIVGAPNVPGNLRPAVLVAPNGVPLIHIQTPSAAGVSRNVYNQFSVGANGAILNNSRVSARTQLGGFVQGNPNLARGSARVILNEVNGGAPSQLRGYIEVGGQRAELIIANPAGISVNGGGFINASRATLTTGMPQFNTIGGLDGFVVRGGTVTVDGAGLDASKTDYAAILARAVQVNAAIWASELKVVTGANQVSVDHSQIVPAMGTGTAPNFALDVAALGGMYANKISLIGTEAGLGVRNAGNIGAGAGGLVVTVTGRLENLGMLEGQRVELSAQADISNRGGTIRQASMVDLTIASPALSNTGGGVIGAEPAGAVAASSTNSGNTGHGSGGGTTPPLAIDGDTTAAGVASAPVMYPPSAPGSIAAGGTIFNDGGRIYAGGPIALNTPQVSNTGGTLNVATMAVSGPNFSNSGGTLNVSNGFSANVGQLDNSAGTLQAGSLWINTANDLLNADGKLASDSNTNLAVGGKVDNTRGTISAAQALIAGVAGAVNNTSGTLIANNNLVLTSSSLGAVKGTVQSVNANTRLTVTNQLSNVGGTIGAGADVSVQSGSLSNSGSIRGTNNATLTVSGALINDGSITAGRHTTITADSMASGSRGLLGAGLQNDGGLGGIGDLRVTTSGALVANGINLAAGNATLRGASVDVSGKQTVGTNIAITATQGNVSTGGAMVTTPGTLSVTANSQSAQTLINNAGQLNAGQLDLQVSNITNTNRGEIVQTGTAASAIAVSGVIDNSGGRIASNGNTAVVADTLDNTGGVVAAARGDLSVTTFGKITNDKGALQAVGKVALVNGGLVNAGGKVFGDSLTVNTGGGDLDNSKKGTLSATTTVDLKSGALNNDTGLIQSGGAMTVDTGGKLLTNTNAKDYSTKPDDLLGGINSAGTLTLKNTGDVNNTAGFIGSKNALDASTQAFSNGGGGVVFGQSTVMINTRGADYVNSAGQTLAMGGLLVNAGSVTNTKGLIRSAAATSLIAGDVSNSSTLDPNQGIEGKSVGIDAVNLGNVSGAIRADVDANIISGGRVDNSKGLISAANELSIKDPNAVTNPGAKTLRLINTNGTLVADKPLKVDAASFSGDGKVVSGQDLRIALTQNTVNNGEVVSNGNLTYTTAGSFENNSKLLAGKTLTVGGSDVNNTAGAEMSGTNTTVNAASALTNRGLLDSKGNTQLNVGTLNNIGTGRIYGNAISIAAGVLNNEADPSGSAKAATIAARDTLDIGASTINNREQALIFSGGPGAKSMRIGGALDANRNAIGQGSVLDNLSADIESLGGLWISMAQVNNRDTHIKLGPQVTTQRAFTTIGVERIGHFAPETVIYSQGKLPVWSRNADGSRGALLNPGGNVWGTWQHITTTVSDTAVDVDPARIVAGGDMNVNGRLYNENSKVLAGGAINAPDYVAGPRPSGRSTSNDVGSVSDRFGKYQETVPIFLPSQQIDLGGYEYKPYFNATKGYGAGAAPLGSANANAGGANPIVQVPASVGKALQPSGATVDRASGASGLGDAGASRTLPMVVRTSMPNVAIPRASLFNLYAGSGGRYLIETDPRFANYRNWLSSDYLLNNLGLDPSNSLKRLGDGFYEQKLIREQVAQLTGYRFLQGFSDDDEQYTALMNEGATFARQYGLRPGIALSAAQMAQLTSDIVWLVEQTVTLPDGGVRQVLVPQLYVRVRPGDIDGAGSLLSADRTVIKGGGDLVNTGTIAGRTMVRIDKDNVNNLTGGRIAGGDVGINARNDLNNIGASITADNSSTLTAGRDINVRTTTQSASGAGGLTSATFIDHVAGVYVSNPGGTLIASAGRDVGLIGAVLTSGGSAAVGAGRNINMATVTEASDIKYAGKRTTGSASQSREVGSQIRGGDVVTLDAMRDVLVRGSSINAQGDLTVKAREGNVTIEAGRATDAVDSTSTSKKKGFLSSKTTTQRDGLREDTSISSALGGRNITVSGRDVTVSGSEVIADKKAALIAKRNLAIEAVQNTRSENSFRGTEKSGLMGSGGFGFTVGSRSQSTDTRVNSTSAARSTVGSIGGDTTLIAGNQYTQIGSNVVAPDGDVTIAAKSIAVREARETSLTETEQKQKSGGLTIALTAPVVSAVQSIGSTAKAMTQTGSGRMQALGAASIAADAKGAADAMGGASMVNPVQSMGVNLSISLGGSQNKSNRTETSDTAAGSRVEGKSVRLLALGGGEDSNILLQGSDIVARDTAALAADNRIDVVAAQNTSDQHSTNEGSGGSVGVSFGTSGLLFNIGANGSKGKSNGTDTRYTNSRISAGKTVSTASGGDTTIRGGVIAADRVSADVGGDLKIESVQDTSKSESKQQSVGGSLSVGFGVWSVGVSASSAKAGGNYASVKEQSGIKAGDGGFNVNVAGSADLKGAVIESTQAAVDSAKNSFKSASLTTSDIQNVDTHKASGASLSVGASGQQAKEEDSKKPAPGSDFKVATSGSAGAGGASGEQAGVTRAGISGVAGDQGVRTGTDSTHALVKKWNIEKLVQDAQAQAQISAQFGQSASKAVGDFANTKLKEANDLHERAAAEVHPDKKTALYVQADQLENDWREGGAYRIAAHAVVGGLTGGAGGATGAAASSIAVPAIGEQISNLDLPVPIKEALVMAASAAIGAAAGGAAGVAGGFNEASNNYLTAADLRNRQQKIDDCRARKDPACEVDILRAYELKSAINTGELKGSTLIEKMSLESVRAGLERLLLDPSANDETKAQARRSLKEVNTAINVIDKAPLVKEAVALGLVAVDIATLGELAVTKVLTTSIVKEFVLNRTGKAISDDIAEQVALNFYRDGEGFAQVARRDFVAGTAARAETINAGQVIDRDGLPRIDAAKRRGEALMNQMRSDTATLTQNEELKQMLGQSPTYWNTSYPAWKEGTIVVDRVIAKPETYRMVIDEKQLKAITYALDSKNSKAAAEQLGAWATKDPINSLADVRNNLAITEGFKSGKLYAIEFKVNAGVGVREGTVGPMWDSAASRTLSGGGNQINFMIGRPAVNGGSFEINASSIKELK